MSIMTYQGRHILSSSRHASIYYLSITGIVISLVIVGCETFNQTIEDTPSNKKMLLLYEQIQHKYANDTCNIIGYGIASDYNAVAAYQIAESNAWNNLSESIQLFIAASLEVISNDTREIFVQDNKVTSTSLKYPPYVIPEIFYSGVESDSVAVVSVIIRYNRKSYYEDNILPHIPALNHYKIKR